MINFNDKLKEEFPGVWEEGLLVADGFEDAFMGIDILIMRDGMDREEAEEYFEYNVQGAYVGENTPVFLELNVENNKKINPFN
eukprot:SAG11_NODE_148_length_14747_cov_217.933517_19_plen_83_part_00